MQSDIEGRLEGADAHLRASVERVLAYVLAALAHAQHGHLAWVTRQLLPDSADQDHLLRWVDIFGLERKEPTAAAGTVRVTGLVGTLVEAGTRWRRSDGVEYESATDVVLAAETADVEITAIEPGVDGNSDAGTKLALIAPVAGLQAEAMVDAELAGGADEEKIEDLRDRLLLRIRTPPKGGGVGEYRGWALEVPGVTRAWEFPHQYGLGTIGLTFAADDLEGGPIPSETLRAAVQDHLDAVAPLTAQVQVWLPVPKPIDPELSVVPDTPEVRAAVVAGLEAVVQREAVPGGTVRISHLREAISLAAGETDHDLVVPAGDVVAASNELVVLGEVTWL